MRMKNKKWAIPFLNEHQEIALYNVDYANSALIDFLKSKTLHLEIGTGKGDFILNMAQKNPNDSFLGIEKNTTCLAITAKKIITNEIKNVLLVADDVLKLFAFLPSHSLDTIFLNFSDPWPKKRHAKRRLTYDSYLKEYARILKSNGKLIMKTDNLDLFEFTLESLKNCNFICELVDYDYQGNDNFDTMTEYEAYFRKEGTPIKRLIAKVGQQNEIK